MPMATDHHTLGDQEATGCRLDRRQWALAIASGLFAPRLWAQPAASDATRLVAAWQLPDEHRIGLLKVDQGLTSVERSLEIPTRAHGLLNEPGGSVLAVARRPGDWMLRWAPATGQAQWQWIEGDRRFNGHAAHSLNQPVIWTTETDLESAQGLLGIRDRDSLEKTGEWPTGGMDPHQILVLPERLGEWPAGTPLVANGGIPTLPETGRSKRDLERMDASLVALHGGGVVGQWRLNDPYLSIRHLAWDPTSQTVGVALQAEHPDEAARLAAPVLAVWNGRQLRVGTNPPSLQGYGGDICARPGGGFIVSCPRAQGVALFQADASCSGFIDLRDGCALAANGHAWWAAGSQAVLSGTAHSPAATTHLAHFRAAQSQMENHWQIQP